jgi:alkylation response protein AidB-like acyl-CoA dehydrogenase
VQFEFDHEQSSLQDSVRRFLTERYGFETRRACLAQPFGCSGEVWQAFAEQGFLGVGLPEVHGGFGGATERMLVMEEIGRALVLEPYLSTVALCAPLIAAQGTPQQQAQLLPRIVAGGLRLALAHGEAEARYRDAIAATARRSGAGYVLDGTKTTVPDGAVADLLLVSALLDGATAVFLVAPDGPGVRMARYRTQDGRSAADVFLTAAAVAGDALLGGSARRSDAQDVLDAQNARDARHSRDAHDALAHAIECGIAALCAEAVGAMEAANTATIEYTRSRQQFGQPIGRFQALQHRMADMFVQATQARSMSILATGRCAAHGRSGEGRSDQGRSDQGDDAVRRRDVAAAKCYVGKAARFVGQQAVQLHGGMGMADELPVSHYFKRLTMIDMTCGDSMHHLAVVSDAILRETKLEEGRTREAAP